MTRGGWLLAGALVIAGLGVALRNAVDAPAAAPTLTVEVGAASTGADSPNAIVGSRSRDFGARRSVLATVRAQQGSGATLADRAEAIDLAMRDRGDGPAIELEELPPPPIAVPLDQLHLSPSAIEAIALPPPPPPPGSEPIN